MKSHFIAILYTAVILLVISCRSSDEQVSTQKYIKNINQWHAERADKFQKKDSWLTLAGLYEIKNGTHTIGSDSTNDIVFPPDAANHIGSISRIDTTFIFKADDKAKIKLNEDKIVKKQLIPDNQGTSTTLSQGSFHWYIIERRDNYYLRLKNSKHPHLTSFTGIKHFPISQNWKVKATFNRFDNPQTISIPDVLGDVYQDSLYGTLEFTLNGQQYSLAPLGNPDTDDRFFIILGDLTNGESTYSGGRYLYVPTPDKEGTTYIDFNKSYNPPCVFTRFATCPLPPDRNQLNINVEAGEKMY